jgi:3-oxoacyl-[acyl-carrier protein] reductase
MREERWGRIVGIQSSSGKQPVDNIDLSNGIRPGSAGLMKAIMPGVAQDGITINLVLPGTCRTARVTDRLAAVPVEVAQQIEAQLAAAIPIGRLGEPSELGHLLAFLASEQASYITGAVYQVDGGSIKPNV